MNYKHSLISYSLFFIENLKFTEKEKVENTISAERRPFISIMVFICLLNRLFVFQLGVYQRLNNFWLIHQIA